MIDHEPTSGEQEEYKVSNVWGLRTVRSKKMQTLASWKVMPGKLALIGNKKKSVSTGWANPKGPAFPLWVLPCMTFI